MGTRSRRAATTRPAACLTSAPTRSWPCTATTILSVASRAWPSQSREGSCSQDMMTLTAISGIRYVQSAQVRHFAGWLKNGDASLMMIKVLAKGPFTMVTTFGLQEKYAIKLREKICVYVTEDKNLTLLWQTFCNLNLVNLRVNGPSGTVVTLWEMVYCSGALSLLFNLVSGGLALIFTGLRCYGSLPNDCKNSLMSPNLHIAIFFPDHHHGH